MSGPIEQAGAAYREAGLALKAGPPYPPRRGTRRRLAPTVPSLHRVRNVLARATGLEAATSGVTGRPSNQLSYARAAGGPFRPQGCWRQGSEQRNTESKSRLA